MTTFTIFPGNHASSGALATAFGLPIAVVARPGNNTISAAGALGIPTVLAEVGGNGLWDEAGVSVLGNGIARVMAHLQMGGEVATSAASPHFVTMSVPLSPASGLWYPAKDLSDPVSVGDQLGEIRDVFGTSLAIVEAEAEAEGIVLYRLTTLAVNIGEALIGIGTPRA